MPGPADWSHEGVDYAVSRGEPPHTDRNPDTDVGTAWYTDGVLWAAEHDIVSGIGDGRFDRTAM